LRKLHKKDSSKRKREVNLRALQCGLTEVGSNHSGGGEGGGAKRARKKQLIITIKRYFQGKSPTNTRFRGKNEAEPTRTGGGQKERKKDMARYVRTGKQVQGKVWLGT